MNGSRPWVITAAVLVGLVVVCVLSRVATGVRDPVARETLEQAEIILRAANKWAALAQQDENPVLALMHICYAKAYVGVLRRVLSDDQVSRAHGVDMRALEQEMEAVERKALARLSAKAPGVMPEGEFAVRTGWIG